MYTCIIQLEHISRYCADFKINPRRNCLRGCNISCLFHDEKFDKRSASNCKTAKPFKSDTAPAKLGVITVELSETKLGTFPLLLLGGIIENQNSDFVMQ
jgi:hypothetical protein